MHGRRRVAVESAGAAHIARGAAMGLPRRPSKRRRAYQDLSPAAEDAIDNVPTPWFSRCAMFGCVVAFGCEMWTNDWIFLPLSCPSTCNADASPCYKDGSPCEANMMLGPPLSVLRRMGAKLGEDIFVRGEWWRVAACNWLHAGVFHLICNVMGILNLGVPLERLYGGLSVGAVYLFSGISGVLMSLLFMPRVLTVGASGSVFGLIGAHWADLVSMCLSCQLCGAMLQLLPLVLFTSLNLLVGFSPWVDNWVHLGGFFGGFVGALAFFAPPKHLQNPFHPCVRLVSASALVLFILTAEQAVRSDTLRSAIRGACGSACERLNCIEPWYQQGSGGSADATAADAAGIARDGRRYSPLWSCCMATAPVQCSVVSIIAAPGAAPANDAPLRRRLLIRTKGQRGLSAVEIAAASGIFWEHDRDASATIDKEEWVGMMQDVARRTGRPAFAPQELDRAFAEADVDGSGSIDLHEWVQAQGAALDSSGVIKSQPTASTGPLDGGSTVEDARMGREAPPPIWEGYFTDMGREAAPPHAPPPPASWVNVTCLVEGELPTQHSCRSGMVDAEGRRLCDPAETRALCERFCFCGQGYYRVYVDGIDQAPRVELHAVH